MTHHSVQCHSRYVSLDEKVTTFSLAPHVGGAGHSRGLQSTDLAAMQVHWWQLAVHVSPGYGSCQVDTCYSSEGWQQVWTQAKRNGILTTFSSPSGPRHTVNMKLIKWRLHLATCNRLFVDNDQAAIVANGLGFQSPWVCAPTGA